MRTLDQICEIMLNQIRSDIYEHKNKTNRDITKLNI